MSTFFDQAMLYTRLGFQVFPLKERSKIPCTERGVHDASDDPEVIAKWSRAYPNANIAVGCGPDSGICVVDVDKHHNGIETLTELIQQHGALPTCPKVQTPQGGYHLYFAYDPLIGNSVGSTTVGLGVGLDVKSKGGYVVLPPSEWDGYKKGKKVCEGGRYTWRLAPRGSKMPSMPEWMIDTLKPKQLKRHRAQNWDRSNLSLVKADQLLSYIDNCEYQTWIQVGMALKSEFGDTGFALWDNWSARGYPDHDAQECQSKWRSFKQVHSLTMGTLVHHAKGAGAPVQEIFKGKSEHEPKHNSERQNTKGYDYDR